MNKTSVIAENGTTLEFTIDIEESSIIRHIMVYPDTQSDPIKATGVLRRRDDDNFTLTLLDQFTSYDGSDVSARKPAINERTFFVPDDSQFYLDFSIFNDTGTDELIHAYVVYEQIRGIFL